MGMRVWSEKSRLPKTSNFGNLGKLEESSKARLLACQQKKCITLCSQLGVTKPLLPVWTCFTSLTGFLTSESCTQSRLRASIMAAELHNSMRAVVLLPNVHGEEAIEHTKEV